MAERVIKPKVKTGNNTADEIKIPYNVLSNPPDLSVYVTTENTTQTISGKKSFTNTIVKKSNTIDLNKPNGAQWNYIEFTDKNDDRIGIAGSRFDAGGYAGVYLQARNSQQLWIASSTPDSNGNTVTKTSTPTPPDNDNSTQIANTSWVLRNYNNADICYRGVDSNAKYSGYYKVAEATLPTWYRISSARVFVQDFDSADNGILNVNVYAGSTKVDGVATASTTAQVGFLEGTNCLGIKGHFFIVVRKQSTTEKKPIKVELWYRQTGAYQRISATFINDIGDSRGGLTASNKWVKFTRTGAQEQSYFDKNVVDLTNGFVPNGKFTTTDIALDGYPVTEIYDDSTNNAQFIAGSIRVANSQTARSDTPTTASKREIIFTDKNNASIAIIQSSVGSAWNGLNLALTNKSGDGNSIEFVHDNPRSVWRFNPSSASLPIELGEPNRPWTNAYIKDNIYISQTSGENAGITWQSASDKTNRGIFRHYDDGTTETFVTQSGGFLFRPLNNNNTKSIKVDPAVGALYPEQNSGADLGKTAQRWNAIYAGNTGVRSTGNIICDSKVVSYSAVESNNEVPNFNGILKDDIYTTAPTKTRGAQYLARDKNGAYIGGLRVYHDTDGTIQAQLMCRSQNTDVQNHVCFRARKSATAQTDNYMFSFIPKTNGNVDLGLSTNKWNNAYANNIHANNIPFDSNGLSTGTLGSTKLPSTGRYYIECENVQFSGAGTDLVSCVLYFDNKYCSQSGIFIVNLYNTFTYYYYHIEVTKSGIVSITTYTASDNTTLDSNGSTEITGTFKYKKID